MLCLRDGCHFLRHADNKNNGGTHCCFACKIGNGHEPFCQRRTTMGISLGFLCESAIKGVELGIRTTKQHGYFTCPFDLCMTNYAGIILCIKEKFKYFCDISYLSIIPASFSAGTIISSERLIYNTRYNFIFNHESPDHSCLWAKEAWPGGKTHFIDNNYAFFIKRYKQRITNFLTYLEAGGEITFILGNYEPNVDELDAALKLTHPKLVFNILHYKPYVSIELYNNYHKLMLRKTEQT
jgi:hypothetical protein